MQIERFYLGCLAHASYIVSSGGEAAVVDPQRDVQIYLDALKDKGLKLRWIIETHLHADFVSGHVELAKRTGATICVGDASGALFPHQPVKDGDVLPLGDGYLKILTTPGHTPESICIVVHQDNNPTAVLTGDTLFIGDVGRPDLSPNHTPQQLAGLLYDSLHTKVLQLPDDTIVYPAHGAGSLCGRSMSTDSESTIGRERVRNYALQAKTREDFIELLTADLPPRPAYFAEEAQKNREGAAALEELPPMRALTADEVEAMSADPGVMLLDTRPVMEFAVAHIPGSLHIGLSGQFASWAARVIGLHHRIVLISEDAEEPRMRLARVGMDNVAGYLDGGIVTWLAAGKATNYVPQISVQELAEWREQRASEISLLDVRESGERNCGAFATAAHIPLGDLPKRYTELDPNRMLFVHCKGGYRSSIATSYLRRAGFPQVINLTGGFDAWKTAYPGIL
jgi:glyoxylase-like metal-dependent hydrolase (beta-lactamase superfamily II)/rhodanese-related sulfurtransferase